MATRERIQFALDDSDDEAEECLKQKVFYMPAADDNDDLSLPPMNGEQFLRRVMAEKQHYPGVAVASVNLIPQQSNQLPQDAEKNSCKKEFLPSKECQVTTMSDFSSLRLNMEVLRPKAKNDPTAVEVRNSLPKLDEESKWLEMVIKETPTTRLCLSMPQDKLLNLLGLFRDWLADGDISISLASQWVYCMLACLELPVLPHVYSSLRQIASIFIQYRANMESLNGDELARINVIVCIIGRYFNQTDLADPYS